MVSAPYFFLYKVNKWLTSTISPSQYVPPKSCCHPTAKFPGNQAIIMMGKTSLVKVLRKQEASVMYIVHGVWRKLNL